MLADTKNAPPPHAGMIFYSGYNSLPSHACRIVLHEKKVECDIRLINEIRNPRSELAELNPYNETPTLADRELVLYGPQTICEYLDERYPHPPLMPIDPVDRGRLRLGVMCMERDWLRHIRNNADVSIKIPASVRTSIRDWLISASRRFKEQDYLIGEELTLADCFVAPLLWRLKAFDIELPRQARPVMKYAERLFSRPAFHASLTEYERELR